MKYKALVSFASIEVSMAMGEVKEVPEPIAKDLLKAKYIEVEGEQNEQSKIPQTSKRKRRQ